MRRLAACVSWVKVILRFYWWRLRGYSPIFGRDWNYDDERRDRVIGYHSGYGRVTITDRKTWREILP